MKTSQEPNDNDQPILTIVSPAIQAFIQGITDGLKKGEHILLAFLFLTGSIYLFVIAVTGQALFVLPGTLVDTPGRIGAGAIGILLLAAAFLRSLRPSKSTNGHDRMVSTDVEEHIANEISVRIIECIKELHRTKSGRVTANDVYERLWAQGLINDSDYQQLGNFLLPKQ